MPLMFMIIIYEGGITPNLKKAILFGLNQSRPLSLNRRETCQW